MPVDPILETQDKDAIAQLQFFARGIVEGLTGGRHRSPHKGSSVEFKEHRAYVRGDEIKSIDWKLFGKTDRLFIRQYEDETNLRAMILLDQSGSMGYAGSRSGGLSKHQFSVKLSACLATLLIGQQDAVGLSTLDTQVRATVPVRSSPSHLRSIMATLAASSTGGETSLAGALKQTAAKLQRRGALVLVSDCFDDADSLISSLKHFQLSGHDVIVFQVWDPDELDFPFRNRTEFRSLENTALHRVDPQALRAAYLKRVEEFQAKLGYEAAKRRIEWISCTTAESCGDVIARFLAKRNRSRGRQRSQERRR